MLLSFDLRCSCSLVWTMMSLLLGEVTPRSSQTNTTGDIQTDAKLTLQFYGGGGGGGVLGGGGISLDKENIIQLQMC